VSGTVMVGMLGGRAVEFEEEARVRRVTVREGSARRAGRMCRPMEPVAPMRRILRKGAGADMMVVGVVLSCRDGALIKVITCTESEAVGV